MHDVAASKAATYLYKPGCLCYTDASFFRPRALLAGGVLGSGKAGKDFVGFAFKRGSGCFYLAAVLFLCGAELFPSCQPFADMIQF